MMANLMGGDGLIVLIVALVVLVGGSQLPKIARNVGLAGKEFRKAQSEAEAEAAQQKEQKAQAETPAPPPPVALPTQAAGPAPSGPVAPAAAGPGATPAGDPVAPPPDDGSITLTPAQLDALLKAREQQVRNEAGSN
jgi:sec-independent protein translocase protein TatA